MARLEQLEQWRARGADVSASVRTLLGTAVEAMPQPAHPHDVTKIVEELNLGRSAA